MKAESVTRKVMKHMLVLNDVSWAQQEDVFDFLKALNVEGLEKQIQVLTRTKTAIGLIPPEAYEDLEQPQQCIRSINDVLDQLIEQEEYGS